MVMELVILCCANSSSFPSREAAGFAAHRTARALPIARCTCCLILVPRYLTCATAHAIPPVSRRPTDDADSGERIRSRLRNRCRRFICRRPPMSRVVFASAVLFFAAINIHAQSWSTGPCDGDEGNTRNTWLLGHSDRVCELRRTVLPLIGGEFGVTGTNGGIEVIGEDRSDIALEARVTAEASSQDEAKALVQQIKINTNGVIHADGPQGSGWSHRSWSVNYRLHVPRRVSVDLRTVNGGIALAHLDGTLRADTMNGGLSLNDLAGDVHAITVNGGVSVELSGDRWQGAGLFAQSTNGGIGNGTRSLLSASGRGDSEWRHLRRLSHHPPRRHQQPPRHHAWRRRSHHPDENHPWWRLHCEGLNRRMRPASSMSCCESGISFLTQKPQRNRPRAAANRSAAKNDKWRQQRTLHWSKRHLDGESAESITQDFPFRCNLLPAAPDISAPYFALHRIDC